MSGARASVAGAVVLFIATALMAVMMVAVTVRALLASTSSRQRAPSCLLTETREQSSAALEPRLH